MKQQKELEARRKEAVSLCSTGSWTQKELAKDSGVHKRPIEKWVHNHQKNGLDLIPHAVPECALNFKQLKQLEKLLLKGSFSLGFDDGFGTYPRVCLLIERKFGLHYHPDSVSKILHRHLG